MIDFHGSTAPSGMAPMIMLEELREEFALQTFEQSSVEMRALSSSTSSLFHSGAAIIDHAPAQSADCIKVFGPGAILFYLAEKHKELLPAAGSERVAVLQWVFWQVGTLEPILDQFFGLASRTPDSEDLDRKQSTHEKEHLLGLLNARLDGREFITNSYSIADIAIFPWIYRLQGESNETVGNVHLTSWHDRLWNRPAVIRAYERVEAINTHTNTEL